MSMIVYGADGELREDIWAILSTVATSTLGACRSWDDLRPTSGASSVIINAGWAGVDGNLVHVPDSELVQLSTTAGTRYHTVYIEIDRAVANGATAELKASSSSSWSPPPEVVRDSEGKASKSHIIVACAKTSGSSIVEFEDIRLVYGGDSHTYTGFKTTWCHPVRHGALLQSYSGAQWAGIATPEGDREWVLASSGGVLFYEAEIRGQLTPTSDPNRRMLLAASGRITPAHAGAIVDVKATFQVRSQGEGTVTTTLEHWWTRPGGSSTSAEIVCHRQSRQRPQASGAGQDIHHFDLQWSGKLPAGTHYFRVGGSHDDSKKRNAWVDTVKGNRLTVQVSGYSST